MHENEFHDYFYNENNLKKYNKLNFLCSDDIYFNLHNEIIKFSSEVEEFNEKNKNLFKDLLEKMTESIQKILPDSIVTQ